MGIIFDTSTLVGLERTSLSLEKLVKGRESEPFGISMISVSELLHAVQRADSEARRELRQAFVEKILEIFPLYPFDLSASRVYARLWGQFIKKGVVVGSHDLMIASTCLSLGFSVLTAEIRDYRKIEGLRIEELLA
jgi:predicted nucleic acid-binding protein